MWKRDRILNSDISLQEDYVYGVKFPPDEDNRNAQTIRRGEEGDDIEPAPVVERSDDTNRACVVRYTQSIETHSEAEGVNISQTTPKIEGSEDVEDTSSVEYTQIVKDYL
ncbi:Fc.00g059360.m01.CDS01 [Cosmosporella sp. VM-42]